MTPPLVFSGVVHPERADVHLAGDFRVEIQFSTGPVEVRFVIQYSQVSCLVTSCPNEIDIETLKIAVLGLIQSAVDAVGYGRNCGYTVEIISCLDCKGTQRVFSVQLGTTEEKHEERQDTAGYLSLAIDNPAVRRAMGDIREAVLAPQDTAFFAYRSMEAVRTHFGESFESEDREVAWKRMREALNVSEAWIKRTADLAWPARHGGSRQLSGVQRSQCTEDARELVWRLIKLIVSGKERLDEAQFPMLTV